jgi:hypothetical protein
MRRRCIALRDLDLSWLLHFGSSGHEMALIGQANVAKSLVSITFRAAGVCDESVALFIAHFPHLEYLDLEYCNDVTDEGARSIARYASSKLKWVGLGENDEVTDEVIDPDNLELLLDKLRAEIMAEA